MIFGAVTGAHEPHVQLFLKDTKGIETPINFLVDTGFNGYLALPLKWIQHLALVPADVISVTLTNNRVAQVALYEAVLLWEEQERSVEVMELEGDPLLGTSLLFDFQLTVQFVYGGQVRIERLTQSD